MESLVGGPVVTMVDSHAGDLGVIVTVVLLLLTIVFFVSKIFFYCMFSFLLVFCNICFTAEHPVSEMCDNRVK